MNHHRYFLRHFLSAIILLIIFFPSAFLHAQPAPWHLIELPGSGGGKPMQRLVDGSIIAGRGEALVRSVDNGEHWAHAAIIGDITCIAIDSAGHVFTGTTHGLFRSDDTGKTWGASYSPPPREEITGLAVDSRNNLYVATVWGIYRSSDIGRTWNDLGIGQKYGGVRAVAVDHDDRIFITVHSMGIYRSTDGGMHWDSLNPIEFIAYAVTPENTLIGATPVSLHRSTDHGEHWNRSTGISSVSGIHEVRVNPQGVIHVATTRPSGSGSIGRGVMQSTNDGEDYGEFFTGKSIISIETTSNDGFLISTSEGLYRSVDQGASWNLIEPRMTLSPVSSLASNSKGEIFAGTMTGLYHSADGGSTWSRSATGGVMHGPIAGVQVDGEEYIWVLSKPGALYNSINSGKSWRSIPGMPDDRIIISFTVNARGNVFAIARHPDPLRPDHYRLYRYDATGTEWLVVDIPSYPQSWSVPVADDNGDIYVGTDVGVYQSKDDGATWILAVPRPENADTCRPMIPERGVIFVSISHGNSPTYELLRSTDRGIQWEIAGKPAGGLVYAMAKDSYGNIFAINDSGIHRSRNLGNNWEWFSEGLQNSRVSALTAIYNLPYGYIFAGTSNGIYRNSSATSSVNKFPASKEISLLEQNIPNPVGAFTAIRFRLASAQQVTVGVYDAFGRELAVLMNGKKEKGSHEVIFDATGLPEGIYFYRLRAGASISTRTMTVVR